MKEWIQDKWEDIYDSEMSLGWNLGNWWGKLTHPFTRTYHWLVKSIQYSIFLWSDFDWDYSYILKLLQYKIRRTRERIVDNDLVMSVDLYAAQMKHAEALIDRYFDDNFCEELYTAHEEKWGKSKMEFTPVPNSNGLSTMDMRYPKATTEEETDQADKERIEIYQKHEEERQKCLDEIFSHIRKHIELWWE